ncbi:HpcH/HpaI aldolase/citrate lyase family protein [Cupriavidus alkaliphilus]|uniref:HpcH/HpaI aldolase/citrate lyase family protein n=1 Tax=Cupriavidus alkaliphilus TaxID=942866 RepID=UPI00161509B3|nr:CoA ester lyase [Cupriavidus alkaliphilus]MBB3014061.1 citrate lyase subunit beta/citryl-CoA lyase [Cupriavidus alkaliphilus]
MRSLLFVPAHDERKRAKGLDCGADALIIDLEDAVPEAEKARARVACAEFVAQHRDRLPLFVRVNALDSGLLLDDLAAVVRARPYGIMLPKCTGGRDVALVNAYLDALEARDGVPAGAIRILPIVTESAGALFDMGSYAREAGPRLCGMMWGGEDLATDVGATANRADGQYTAPFALARSLCLFGAAAAGVPAVDAVYTDFRDPDGLAAEARTATAAGFSAKAAIHPAQIEPINTVFTPGEQALRHATTVVAAFAQQPHAGAVSIDGRMFDRPHLKAAERVLARTARPQPQPVG